MSQTKAQLISGTSTQDVTFDDATVSSLNGGPIAGARNRIINGDMRIDQRNAGASVTPTTTGARTYTLDRWAGYTSAASKYTVQQNAGSVTPPPGFTNYLGVTSTSAYSVTSSDIILLQHLFEGYNISDFAFGTANAKTVTLSFWVRSSLTGTFGGSLVNQGTTRSYPFSYTISAANTWEQKSITIPGDTGGTWTIDNQTGLHLSFQLGTGSTYTGTAGSWAGTGYWGVTGAVNLVGTNGATFYITGVQLEAGSVATPFERRSYGQELALCERYYQVYGGIFGFICHNNGTSNAYGGMPLRVKMRANPTADYIAPYNGGNVIYYSAGSSRTLTGLGLNIGRPDYAQLVVSGAGTLGTSGNAGHLDINDSRALSLTAEL